MSFAPATKTSDVKAVMASDEKEYFKGISKIQYEGPSSTNPLAFKHYNAEEVIEGRTMAEWCRFGVCFWHTFRGGGNDPFGFATMDRPWDDGSNSMEVLH